MTFVDIDGWFDENFAYLYMDRVNFAPNNKESTFVEVGSWFGKSTAFMGHLIKTSNPPKDIKFYAVDTWEGSINEELHKEIVAKHGGSIFEVFSSNMRKCNVDKYITPLKMTSEQASFKFIDKSLDFVFLDANHSYEECKKDIEYWLPKIKVGGLLAGHDYDWPGVKQAVKEIFGSSYLVLEPNCWYLTVK